MKQSKLFHASLIGQIVLFIVIAVTLSVFFSFILKTRLTEEFITRGTALSQSIANSSVELLLNRDASTIQATIDQFIDIEHGVAYVFVVDDQGEFFAHTFVPGVPSEVLNITGGAKDQVVIQNLNIANSGEFIDIAAPVLAGSIGFVHIGMDKGVIQATIRSTIIQQVGLIAVIFVIAVAIIYIQTNRISQPIIQLTDFARQMASSSIADQAALQSDPQLLAIAKREDEVGQLTASFQQMVAEIQRREERLKRRATNLEIIANLSERLTAILDVDQLLAEMVNQIKERFAYYHAQIYLLDDQRETLVMAEGSGPAGAKMKARGHSVPLNAPASLVARAARSGEIVRVDNIRESQDWRPNPLLPDTCSEMAVPIMVEGRVAGVLDVQEDKIAALNERDANLLRSLANQVAIAIRNVRLFQETQTALAEVEALNRRLTREAWRDVGDAISTTGYVFSKLGVTPTSTEWLPAMSQAVQQKDLAQDTGNGSDLDQVAASVAIPLTLRDEVIGVIGIERPSDRPWTEDELTAIQTVTEQVALALDSARLARETERAAWRDRTVSETTARIWSSDEVADVMKTAVAQLGEKLKASEVVIQLGTRAAYGAEDEIIEENAS